MYDYVDGKARSKKLFSFPGLNITSILHDFLQNKSYHLDTRYCQNIEKFVQ